jgi:polar amino acid transport system substrate-binding protein
MAAVIGLIPQRLAAGEVIRLTTQDWPPYQMITGDKVDGVAVRVVRCVLDRLGIEPQFTVLPWLQAQQAVREARADGFFGATRDAERDTYAVLSVPIVPETRRWYWRSDHVVDVTDKALPVAVQAGTVMYRWLLGEGYTNLQAAPTTDDLTRLLETGKVDAVFANQLVFDWNVAIAGIPVTAFASATESEHGIGVYFSKSYLAHHPAFLERFNAEATDCRMRAHLSPDPGP